jgi:hypothetical protein
MAVSLITADILGYDLVRGKAWLPHHNPDIMRRDCKWY